LTFSKKSTIIIVVITIKYLYERMGFLWLTTTHMFHVG